MQSLGVTDAPAASATRLSLWRNRDFVLLWGGQSISEVGSAVTQLALPFVAVVVLKSSTLQVGLLAATSTLPFLLISLPAGVIVDRTSKHRLMMWCDVGRFLLLASIPLVTLPWLHLTYLHLVVVSFLAGVLTVFFDVAYQSYLPILLERGDLIDGNGKLGTTQSFAQFVGPSIGGGLIGILGSARTISIDALSYVASAISLFLIRKREPVPVPRVEGATMRRDIKEGLGFVVKHPILRKIVACTGTGNFFSSMGLALDMVFFVRVLHLTPGYIGLIFSLMSIGGMVGGLAARPLSRRVGSARIIWVSALLFSLPPFLLPLAQPGWGVLLYAVGGFFFMLSVVVYNVAQVSYRQAITPPELLGRMNASVRFIVWGTMPLGAAAGGVLGSAIGIRPTLWVAATGGLGAAWFVFFSPLRQMRDVQIHDAYAANEPVAEQAAPSPS